MIDLKANELEVECILCENSIGDEPCFWDVEGGYWCEACGLKERIRIQQERLDTTELAEVKARIEIERLHRFIETLQGVHFKELETEKAENRRLCEALEFYADADWYRRKQGDEIVVLKDGGEIAREALGLVGESNE
ncbi:hypothetical protein [Metasolibacillus sp.]|uniref:hypothetical protein n=1 Tax=Metasolibacillus sp. TaxID=2703680 RepID=UPI0025F0BF9A|nr:hypothetical protein [Metasolibacillus sp.]MCT6926369.1 hypothetical protein [Metasolibacillus sp.]MCT6942599.1 hypothetical protein [Metasolibacillus sp.]